MPRRAIAFAGILFVAITPQPAHAEDPLRRLMPQRVGASLCFARSYDAAHLRRLPRQQMTGVLMSLKYEHDTGSVTGRVQFTRKDRPAPLFVTADCQWSATANRDTSNDPLIPAMRKDDGFVCIAIFKEFSAEEGGHIVFDLPSDGRALTLYFEENVAAAEGNRAARRVKLGPDDRVFRLERADPAACRALEGRGL